MLDFSKSLGTYENIPFYGDHEQEDLIYYFPDEVQLSKLEDSEDEKAYELSLQLFKEGTAVVGNLEDLNENSGAILSLGVVCKVSEKRLEKAAQRLAELLDIDQQDLKFAVPPWKEGRVDLIILDGSTQEGSEESDFIRSIVGSKIPSLIGNDLKSIFQVRLDRRGAALVAAALGEVRDQRHVAGVLFQLKFDGIRPALDLRIRANLSRCQEKISHLFSVGVNTGYVGVKAEMEFITSKLEEDGDIEVEVLSQVTDDETKRLIRETVKEFKDKIIEKLFAPVLLPQDMVAGIVSNMLGNNVSAGGGSMVQLGYKFKKEKNFHDRVIELDYRERSTTTRLFNPQAHLWALGENLDITSYIQIVNFSDLWRENQLEIELLHDFEKEGNDLLSVEVLVWRKRDGINTAAKQGRFAIPEQAQHLSAFTFSSTRKESQQIVWMSEADELAGYYYQARLIYDTEQSDADTLPEVLSKVYSSNSRNLILLPQQLAPSHILEVRAGGGINFEHIRSVDIRLRAKNAANEILTTEFFALQSSNRDFKWKVRRNPDEEIFMEEERHYHYKDGRPPIKSNPIEVVEEELIIDNPLESHRVRIVPIVINPDATQIIQLLFEVKYEHEELQYHFQKTFRGLPPTFDLGEEIVVKTMNATDAVAWKASVVTLEGNIIPLEKGEAVGEGTIILNLKKDENRRLSIHWVGLAPEAMELKYLRLEFRLTVDEEKENLEDIEFSGAQIPALLIYEYPRTGNLEMRTIKRYEDGSKEKDRFSPVNGDTLIVQP